MEQVVNFTEARHNVLAGNIANVDTPGYKPGICRSRISRRRLKQAIESQRDGDVVRVAGRPGLFAGHEHGRSLEGSETSCTTTRTTSAWNSR